MKLPFPRNVGRVVSFAGHTPQSIVGASVPAANGGRQALERWGEVRPVGLPSRAIYIKRSASGFVVPSANRFLRNRMAQRFVY